MPAPNGYIRSQLQDGRFYYWRGDMIWYKGHLFKGDLSRTLTSQLNYYDSLGINQSYTGRGRWRRRRSRWRARRDSWSRWRRRRYWRRRGYIR